jgi:hypothetical protein
MGEDAETRAAVKAAMAEHTKVVVGDDKERQKKCMAEVKLVLARFDCVLLPKAVLSPQGAEFFVETVARPRGMTPGVGIHPDAEEKPRMFAKDEWDEPSEEDEGDGEDSDPEHT